MPSALVLIARVVLCDQRTRASRIERARVRRQLASDYGEAALFSEGDIRFLQSIRSLIASDIPQCQPRCNRALR